MRKTLLPQIIIIIVVVAACISWCVYRYQTDLDEITKQKKVPINLGLDLKGGVHMVLECMLSKEQLSKAQNSPDARKEIAGIVEGVKKVMEKRIDPNGVREVSMQVQGNKWISIDIPGASDPDKIKDKLVKVAKLEFYHVGNMELKKGDPVPEKAIGKKCPDHYGPTEPCLVMTGAEMEPDQTKPDISNGKYNVNFKLTKKGGEIFFNHTRSHIKQYLAIILDGKVLSNPVINGAIFGGSGIIEGNFTQEEVTELATLLNSGSLPVEVRVAESRSVSPTLGKDSLMKSLMAGIVGLGIVLFFMIVVYRLPGLVANASLLLYIIIVFGIMSIFDFTLTLPGIAGFILSIGMAVDANIIIFERLKEELRTGKTLKAAMDAGFTRAFNAILDSNVTTIIAAVVLYAFGSGPIRGFGVTLTLGVIISMFSAITISRTFLMLIIDVKAFQNKALYGVKEAADAA